MMHVRTGICILRHCRHEADYLGGHAARARCCLIFGKLEEGAGKGHEARSGTPCKGEGGRQVIRLYIIEIEARAVTARSTRHFVLQNEKARMAHIEWVLVRHLSHAALSTPQRANGSRDCCGCICWRRVFLCIMYYQVGGNAAIAEERYLQPADLIVPLSCQSPRVRAFRFRGWPLIARSQFHA